MTGSFSRTAINAESGAKSPLSTAVAAVTVVAVLINLTSFLSLLPVPGEYLCTCNYPFFLLARIA